MPILHWIPPASSWYGSVRHPAGLSPGDYLPWLLLSRKVCLPMVAMTSASMPFLCWFVFVLMRAQQRPASPSIARTSSSGAGRCAPLSTCLRCFARQGCCIVSLWPLLLPRPVKWWLWTTTLLTFKTIDFCGGELLVCWTGQCPPHTLTSQR